MSLTRQLVSGAIIDTVGAAVLEFAAPGRIIGVTWAVHGTIDATDEGASWEVSLANQNTVGVNDALNIVSVCSWRNVFDTGTQGAQVAVNFHAGPFAIPVKAGDRAQLNVSVFGTPVTNTCRALLHIDRGGR